jgi:hypothetical protein
MLHGTQAACTRDTTVQGYRTRYRGRSGDLHKRHCCSCLSCQVDCRLTGVQLDPRKARLACISIRQSMRMSINDVMQRSQHARSVTVTALQLLTPRPAGQAAQATRIHTYGVICCLRSAPRVMLFM